MGLLPLHLLIIIANNSINNEGHNRDNGLNIMVASADGSSWRWPFPFPNMHPKHLLQGG